MTTSAAVSLRSIFDEVGYRPHPVQLKFHQAKARHRFRLVCAGRRIGKSQMGGHELTVEALMAKARASELNRYGRRAEFWIVGPEYSDAEKEFRVLYNDLTKLEVPFDRPGTYNDALGGNMHISLWDGKFQVHAKSAKYPESLVGEALEGAVLAEAAKLKPIIWTKYVRPMLADYRGWAMMNSTPEGRNWYYDQYNRGQDPDDLAWWSLRAPSWDNPFLFPEGRRDPEILDMESDMSEEKFQQEIGAEFTDFVGKVFKDWDEDVVVGKFSYNPRWPVFVATDYGWTNPNVVLFLQVDIWDNIVVLAEYYRRQRTIPEVIEDLKEHEIYGPLCRVAKRMFPDPEDPASSRMLSEAFSWKVEGGTGGLIKDRIDLIRKYLRPQPLYLEDGHPDKKPKLRVNRICTQTIREMAEYRYPETKNEQSNEKENPLKVNDHTPEALGRFFAGYYGPKQEHRRTRVRSSKIKGR
jgi:hypothetical protein